MTVFYDRFRPPLLMLWGGSAVSRPFSSATHNLIHSWKMDALSALLSLAPYGLGPAAAAYGGYRAIRGVRKSTRPTKRMRISRPLRVGGVHSFRRTTMLPIAYLPATGFSFAGLSGSALSFTFTLADCRCYLGASSSAVPVPSSTEFSTLFDSWRIRGVKVSAFFQNNTSSTQQITTCMPLLSYVWDKDDHTVASLGDINQFQNVKRFQFGNGAAKSGCLVSYGKPQATSTGVFTAGGATSGQKVEPHSTWMETSAAGIASEYNSMKVVADLFGATQASSEGIISFYFDVTYEMKGVV